jgi:hypothetical protein
MRFVRLRGTGTALAAAACFALCFSAASAERFRPGVGLANPALGINASGYVKWGQSTVAPFIDRMKGAYAWAGRLPSSGKNAGSVIAITNPAIFAGGTPPQQVALEDDTIVDLNRLLVAAVFQRKLISREQNQQIQKSPETFFKIETGPGGKSELLGRLRETDPFKPIVRFDRDIDMDLTALRDNGHLKLTRDDLTVKIGNLALDENGWPTQMPTDLAGRAGTISTALLWYPAETAKAKDSIYGGNFYLLADGQGTLDLDQRGKGPDLLAMKDIRIDGPTVIKFPFTPNGERVGLTITATDPNRTGDYLRNIRVVHERHMPLFEAGEIFTPEYLAFMADFRVIRWMNAMDGHKNPPFFSRAFEDRPKLTFYSFNLGTNGTERNGIPIDAIIAFSNKTGTDPWITVPVNVSDTFAKGMAAYIAANLDPALKLYVELGNENWNGIFPSYRFATKAAHERWGVLQLRKGVNGKLSVATPGRFVSDETLKQSGAGSRRALTKMLGLKHPLLRPEQGWAEWSGMRATQIARIFEDAFHQADAATAPQRVNNVMGTFSVWAGASDLLMKAAVWRQEEPDAWIDPTTVFESLAAGAYFGGYMGSRHSDMVSYWIKTLGQVGAQKMALRHLTAGLDPAKPYIRLDPPMVSRDGKIIPANTVRGVEYHPDLVIDAYPLLQSLHPQIREGLRKGTGVRSGKAMLAGADAGRYLRLAEEGGNTVLQARARAAEDSFQTVLVFKGKTGKTLDQMISDGVILPRSLNNMADEARKYFAGQQGRAKAYGLDLIAYEGGQHMAPAIWGPFRANLKNEPLILLLRSMNQAPEIAALYRYWFDAWRAADGGLFAHYADIGMPGRYGNWGLVPYFGSTQPLHKLAAVLEENRAGAWWQEPRAPAAFQHGVFLEETEAGKAFTGTAKPDWLIATEKDATLSAGPGDDALFMGGADAKANAGEGNDVIVVSRAETTVDGGPGTDTVKAARSIEVLDLAALNAQNIERVDIRNAARTSLSATPADILRLSGGVPFQILAETADTVRLSGFTKLSAGKTPKGFTVRYQGHTGSHTISLTVTTDLPVER